MKTKPKGLTNAETISHPADPMFIRNAGYGVCIRSESARSHRRRPPDHQVHWGHADIARREMGRLYGWLWGLQAGCFHQSNLVGRKRHRKEFSINPRRSVFDNSALVA